MYLSTLHSPLTDNPPHGRKCQEWTKTHVKTCQPSSGNVKRLSWVTGEFRARNKSGHKRLMGSQDSSAMPLASTVSSLLKTNLPAVKHTVLGVIEFLCIYPTHTHLSPTRRAFLGPLLKCLFALYAHMKCLLEVHPRTHSPNTQICSSLKNKK